MKCEYISDIGNEKINEIKEQLGVSDYKNYHIFGLLRTDDLIIYIISVPGPLWPLYLIVEYNNHRYGLLGRDMKMPDYTWWEVGRIDAAYIEKAEIREMLHLVCDYANYIHYPATSEYGVTIITKGYEKMIINSVEKNVYGISLF